MQLPPIPLRDDPLDDKKKLSPIWEKWFRTLREWVNETAPRVGSVAVTGQAAAIGSTDIAASTLRAGTYRISYYARITQAATTSSSLTVTIGWTDRGVACAYSGAAVTGNTTATTQSGSFIVVVDGGTAITYQTAYASVGGQVMTYALDIRVEEAP